MCGIAGIFKWSTTPPPWAAGGGGERAGLTAMAAAIAHRGPDGRGEWVHPSRAIALLHSRLAIIDLPGGQQPMANEDGAARVVFNGEIYNHVELRKELIAQGHRFRSDHSDTEVLVHGWEEWGEELPAKLVGMFAFALYDQRNDTLFLARDRMGQKPLFYATLEDGIVFASTLPAVLAWPEVPRRVPREQVALYLLLGYMPPPQTIYRDISQLLPGSWLRVRRDVVDGRMFWERGTGTMRNAECEVRNGGGELRATLTRAVESQLMADVPLACFLSGGIDSSIVAALMQQASRQNGGPAITTVSVGFPKELGEFDETAYAQAVAEKIGSKHIRLEVAADPQIPATLEQMMAFSLGEPFADSSILPTHALATAVRQIAPVALSGDGADELFGGYDRYRAMTLLAQWPRLARLMPARLRLGGRSTRERWRRLAKAARATIPSERYTRLVELFDPATIETLLPGALNDWFPEPAEYGAGEDISPLRLAMLRDQAEYLPGDVLWKVDSASMATPLGPLEVRSPFLDHRVVALANGLADSALIRGSVGKRILRETFAAELPPIVGARGKQGFAAPVGNYFRGPLKAALHDTLLRAGSFTRAHLHPPTVEAMLGEHERQERDHTHRLFSLFMLELWWQKFSPGIEA